MSHSKRNTSRAVFTSHERSIAKSAWNSTSARLSRDSFLPFASCQLCLLPARTPVSCSHGHIFCRECALSNILSQKKEIKRLEKGREKDEREAEEDRGREDAEAKERAVKEFEKIQMGLEFKIGRKNESRQIVGRVNGKIVVEEDVLGGKNGEKRKFELDEDELLRIAQEERIKVRKTLDEEKAAKTSLPSFWHPSVTPSSNTNTTLHNIAKKVKQSPICPASPATKPHTYSLPTLINVAFTEEKIAATQATQRVCPSCKKALSNTSKAILAKPCGHVLCKTCVRQFMTPKATQDPHAPDIDHTVVLCYVCDANLTAKPDAAAKEKSDRKDNIRPGLVEIQSEGTGFASSGASRVEKAGTAFQC